MTQETQPKTFRERIMEKTKGLAVDLRYLPLRTLQAFKEDPVNPLLAGFCTAALATTIIASNGHPEIGTAAGIALLVGLPVTVIGSIRATYRLRESTGNLVNEMNRINTEKQVNPK